MGVRGGLGLFFHVHGLGKIPEPRTLDGKERFNIRKGGPLTNPSPSILPTYGIILNPQYAFSIR